MEGKAMLSILLLFGIILQVQCSTSVNILGQDYEMNLAKTYDGDSPSSIEIKGTTRTLLFIKTMAFNIGTNFSPLRRENVRPSVKFIFTDRWGNCLENKNGHPTFAVQNTRETTPVATGDGIHTFQFHGDYPRNRVFLISSKVKGEGRGKLFAFDTKDLKISDGKVTAQEITELGDQITAIAVHPSTGNILLSQADDKKFNMITLTAISKEQRDKLTETVAEKVIEKTTEKAIEVITEKAITATTEKVTEKPTTEIPSIYFEVFGTPIPEEVTIAPEATEDLTEEPKRTDLGNRAKEKDPVYLVNEQEYYAAVKRAQEKFIELQEKNTQSRINQLNTENIALRNYAERMRRINKIRIPVIVERASATPAVFDEQLREAVKNIGDELIGIYNTNVLGKSPDMSMGQKSEAEQCKKSLIMLNQRLDRLSRKSTMRRDGSVVGMQSLKTLTPSEASFKEVTAEVSYSCAVTKDLEEMQKQLQQQTLLKELLELPVNA